MTDLSSVKPIAFYLPQFYATPYNDEWWGKGFTEWTSARRAEPLFPGHHQPQLPPTGPNDLGFHNQTDVATLAAQAKMAKAHGVHGFCHYFYWFGGKRVLEKPTELMLRSPEVDMPFCLSWANENWSRRWDGGDTDILIPQDYDPENYHKLAEDLAPYFSDPRYITSGGKALFLIYRPDEIPELGRLADVIRQKAIDCGHKGALVLGTETFVAPGQQLDPRKNGLDGAVEFPPHGVSTMQVHTHTRPGEPDFEGMVFDHFSAFLTALKRPAPDYPLYRGVFPAWDNTARRGRRANIFAGSTPELFAHWLASQSEWTTRRFAPKEQFIFINAWNEWAEGAHLEPDTKDGMAYLETLRDVLGGQYTLKHHFDWNNSSPEYLPYYRSVAEADLGLDALYASRDPQAAQEASLPYELILPPGAMTKQGEGPQPTGAKPITPWREQLRAARNFEDIKRALWLGLYHDYPQTRFQRVSSKILRKIREATR
jgi:lipopolysaccharide biosynthesis protein